MFDYSLTTSSSRGAGVTRPLRLPSTLGSMKPITRGRTLPVLLATAALVGAANLGAYAAAGHPLLLGGHNSSPATTTLTNSGPGPALTLHSSKKDPPLAVSSGRVVKHLNADRVDGMNAGELATQATSYILPNGQTGVSIRVRRPGTFLISVSAVLSLSTPGQCWIEEPDAATPVEPISIFGTAVGAFNTITGSTVATLGRRVGTINFRCTGPFSTTELNPSTLAMVRIPAHRVGHLE